jgi:uncharacterized protein (UPF0216 family)
LSQEFPEETRVQELMAGELRILNANLEYQRTSLAKLILEELPLVACNQGSPLLFKNRELKFLTSILDNEEQKMLFLPMIIEITPGEDAVALLGRIGVEGKILSHILKTLVTPIDGKLLFYKSQLVELRKHLKTSIQYRFTLKETEDTPELLH